MTSREPAGTNRLAADLDHILTHTRGLWESLRGARVFLTGGTGFFGCWLLESLLWANHHERLGAEAVVLTRDPAAFESKVPHLAVHPAVRLHEGDIRSFEFPDGAFSHVIHAATEASARLNEEAPLLMADMITEGTRRALDFARASGVRRFLLTSSGAIYGRQPPDITHIAEDYMGAPDTMNARAAYGEAKRLAELMCAVYHDKYGLETSIARCFAFVGAYLPLDTHFAVGNFIRDGLRGSRISIGGDGTPYRSYMYAADLAIWLWTILLRGAPCRPYNVGSPENLTIAELARTVAGVFDPPSTVERACDPVLGKPSEHYVPSIERAAAELDLRITIDLREAISRTVAWHSLKNR